MAPEPVEACVRSIMDDNPSMDEDRAYAICKDQKEKGNLEDGAELATGCPDGQVDIGGECVPYEGVDAPAPLLNSTPRVMASASPLDTQPIEREELGGGKVAYRNIKLISEGVWTDSNSQTPTLYDEETFENTRPEYDESKYQGPPVNIAHDLHKDGPQAGDPHEASIGGYIEPDSLQTDGSALFGDIVLDTGDTAGAFADENLKSALENNGTAGFSPSVELMPEELEDTDHPRAEEHVITNTLTGTGLVRDPASEDVDLAHETRNRAVALSSGEEVKTLHRESGGMSATGREEIRAEVLNRELAVEDIEDDAQAIADELDIPVGEVMEVLDPLLDMDEEPEEEPEEGGGPEMEDGEKGEDYEDEEDDEQEMQEGGEVVDALQDQVASLAERLEDLEDKMATQDELSEAQAELAAADTVEELREAKDELDKRLSEIEEEPEEARTMADSDGEGFDWSDADSGFEYDSATGSMSGGR